MNPLFKAMQPKKKRPVDPNAPPRPNLLSHEKVIKDQKAMLEHMENEIARLRARVETLESKASHQSSYLSSLHQYVMSKLSKK